MLSVIFLAFAFVAANAQGPIPDYRINPYYDESPKPYAFNYNALLDDGVGQSSRTETADGSGRVQGSYTLNNDEGHSRVVEYVADQNGFRAVVRTNEPGTDNQNPADVVVESAAAPVQYAPVIRKPILNAPVLAPVVEPAVVPAVVPVPVRPVYRRPATIPVRNYAYRRPY
ncbi:cuticle protein 10.9-like [Argiope bruennichi]|uniref:cuticle protein 10.9-like n=1 Tax=Argiope bruennichi TaxID=94029 RepID=UPI002494DC1C|nr:cuticle protein 10.9-like [Argiope bruennichi]